VNIEDDDAMMMMKMMMMMMKMMMMMVILIIGSRLHDDCLWLMLAAHLRFRPFLSTVHLIALLPSMKTYLSSRFIT